MEHDSEVSTRYQSSSMLLCHLFAYSLKLYIEENKLTPVSDGSLLLAGLLFLVDFSQVINLGCRCFQITLFLLLTLLFYFEFMFSLYLALSKDVQCQYGNQNTSLTIE